MRLLPRVVPFLVGVVLSACSSTRILPMPDTPDEVVRSVEAAGPASSLTVNTYDPPPEAEPSAVREAIAGADLDMLRQSSTRYDLRESGRSIGEFLRSGEVSWDHVVVVTHRRTSHSRGLLQGLGIGLAAGAVMLAGMALSDPCETGEWGCSAGEAYGVVVGVPLIVVEFGLIGAIRGARRTTVWRR